MLSFAEEILLLGLDDTGVFKEVPEDTLAYSLSGAVLMDLALQNRIDTDLKHLMLISSEPTGNLILDRALETISREQRVRTTRHWLKLFAARAKETREQALAQLLEKRILRCEEKKALWVFGVRRYPTIDRVERDEIRTRLRGLILGDEIPDPRDVVLISLIEGCQLFNEIFTPHEFARVRPRILMLAKFDLIGQEVNRLVREIKHEIALALDNVG